MEEETRLPSVVVEEPEDIQAPAEDTMQVYDEHESDLVDPFDDDEMEDDLIYYRDPGEPGQSDSCPEIEEPSDSELDESDSTPPHEAAEFVEDDEQSDERRATSEGSIVVEDVVTLDQGESIKDHSGSVDDDASDDFDNIDESDNPEDVDGTEDPEEIETIAVAADSPQSDEGGSGVEIVELISDHHEYTIDRNGELVEEVPDHAEITELPEDTTTNAEPVPAQSSSSPETSAPNVPDSTEGAEPVSHGESAVQKEPTEPAALNTNNTDERNGKTPADHPEVNEPDGPTQHSDLNEPIRTNELIDVTEHTAPEPIVPSETAQPVAPTEPIDLTDQVEAIGSAPPVQQQTSSPPEGVNLQKLENDQDPDVPKTLTELNAKDPVGTSNDASHETPSINTPLNPTVEEAAIEEASDLPVDSIDDINEADDSDDFKKQLEATPVTINYKGESYPLLGKLLDEAPTNSISIEELVDLIRRGVPGLPPDREIILYIEPLGLRIGEDNLYTREATLNDLILLLPTVKNESKASSVEITLECAERFISQLNSLFAELASMPPQKRSRKN